MTYERADAGLIPKVFPFAHFGTAHKKWRMIAPSLALFLAQNKQ